MAVVDAFVRSLRACARTGLLGILLALVLPLALGPAVRPLAEALGLEVQHACACGMKPGTCGCPECARLAHDEVTRVPSAHDEMSSCDDHRVPPLGAPLPLVLPSSGAVIAESPALALLHDDAARRCIPLADGPPPTPPPRSLAA